MKLLQTLREKGAELCARVRRARAHVVASMFALCLAVYLGGMQVAQAAIDTVATDALYTAIDTDVTYLQGKAWALVFTIVGIMISIKLFKKFTNKASG